MNKNRAVGVYICCLMGIQHLLFFNGDIVARILFTSILVKEKENKDQKI